MKVGNKKSEIRRTNGASGMSDIEGKIARVATSKPGGERVSINRDLESMKQSLTLDLFMASWFPD